MNTKSCDYYLQIYGTKPSNENTESARHENCFNDKITPIVVLFK